MTSTERTANTEHDLRNGEYLCANWPKFCYFQALRAYNQVTQDLTDSEKSERDYHLNKLDDEKGHLRYFAVQETCGFGPNQFGPYLLHGAGTLEFLMISCDWKEEYQMEHSSPRYGYKYIRAPSLVGRDWTPVLHDLYAPRLCTFICADIQLNQDIFPILSRFPNLQHVRLRSNKYGRKMRLNILRTFISLKQLRHLHLEDVLLYYGDNRKEDPLEFMEEHIYQHRKKEPNETVATSPIQYIKFDQVNLMTGSLLHAMTYITTLKHIDINFSKECNYNQNELDRFTKLLAHNALFVEYIKLRRLRWSLIWDTLSPLAALPRLKVLDVCGIGAHTVVDASALSNLLKGTNSLQQINIWQIYLIGMRQLTGKRERKVGKYVEKYVVPKDKFISTRSICPSRKQIDIAIESQDFVRNKPPRSRYNRL
ncbi:hypothetical protein BDA99DRAFT_555929 [Phascolomyces articulosus]|uniref:Uncharacterized protein n=1 Tax=Phascolomyces articulosus TaxID=60185 RepID=A0AAD5K8F2_9FUNG|nr:hypothetical protein BDA99DRAFT_555929 [Phascolomyces articulosus]